MNDITHPSAIDIWSLGIVLLETVIGFPIYMAYKGRIIRKNPENGDWTESCTMRGILGETGR